MTRPATDPGGAPAGGAPAAATVAAATVAAPAAAAVAGSVWTADPGHPDRPLRPPPALAAFTEAGVLTAADSQVAAALGRLGGDADPAVLLAAALTVRALRQGAVCVDLGLVAAAVDRDRAAALDDSSVDLAAVRPDTSPHGAHRSPAAAGPDGRQPPPLAPLPWPAPAQWLAACRGSDLVQVHDGPAEGHAAALTPAALTPASPTAAPSTPGAPTPPATDVATHAPAVATDPGASEPDAPEPDAPGPAGEVAPPPAGGGTAADAGAGEGDGSPTPGRLHPLHLHGTLLYLDRYWAHEQSLRAALQERAAASPPVVAAEPLRSVLAALFPGTAPDRQRLAVAAALTGWVTLIAGGPGTGKTTTVARLLVAAQSLRDAPLRVGLAAPTGKAAARLSEAVADALAAGRAGWEAAGLRLPPAVPAVTVHRLLGTRQEAAQRFRHDRDLPLPFDLVVVDETSMVSLLQMARLFEALAPTTQLVLVGDPDQLASVEAGAVLGDLVARGLDLSAAEVLAAPRARLLAPLVARDVPAPGGPDDGARDNPDHGPHEVRRDLAVDTVRLTVAHRFGAEISRLAAAVRDGDVATTLQCLREHSTDPPAGDGGAGGAQPGPAAVRWVDTADASRDPAVLRVLRARVVRQAQVVLAAARAGDSAAARRAVDSHRVLCAHRQGPAGVQWWGTLVAAWLRHDVDGYGAGGPTHLGRPLLVTRNDYEVDVFNGDTGVVIAGPRGPVASFSRGVGELVVPLHRLSHVESAHALTVFKAQGSQFDAVSVVLPEPGSPLLTRELLYTALTRAQTAVLLLGSEEAVRVAVQRPISRASGLRYR